MASYTGKAVGPMLIGKYPSENNRSFSHFDTYYPPNVFVAERLHDAGYRTFAGMCHWYFRPSSGLNQGFDVWDTSAIPPGMSDNDTSVSSDREADLALKLLGDPANTDRGEDKRFFAWFHFFDPHAQYVPHPGAPDFAAGEKGPGAATRALYDQEVWFTDKHIGRILDFIASQPWGKDTAIILTADHGEAFGEHAMAWHGREIWEPLVRVPLVVYVPGAEPRRVAEKRSHIDVAPTILELAALPRPEGRELQGTSLLADVFAPAGAELDERDVLVDMPKGPFNELRRAVITGKSPGTKLLHFGGVYYNLFDLAEDPAEKNDLSSDKEKLSAAIARLQAMRGRLKEFEVKEDEKK
jgi:arylsulfatase A-like enzyme